MTSLEKAMLNPGRCFSHPREVLVQSWNAEDKYRVLRQWKYDVGQLQVATEENMPPPEGGSNVASPKPASLKDINAAMEELGFSATADPVPNKGA